MYSLSATQSSQKLQIIKVAIRSFTSRRKPIIFSGKDKNKPYYLFMLNYQQVP
jgi:hypothetical protein